MNDNKKSFVLYQSYKRMFEALSNDEAGELIKAIFKYADNETDIEINPRWELGFIQITEMLNIDHDKWEEKKIKRAEAGRKGGIKRALNKGQAISSKSKQCLNMLSNAKQTQANQAVNVNVNDNVNVNVNDIYMDTQKTKTTKFQVPSVEEIKNYCTERNNNVNANKFFDFYESKGWKIGKNPMKDWKAAVRTWERGDSGTKVQDVYTSNTNYDQFYVNF